MDTDEAGGADILTKALFVPGPPKRHYVYSPELSLLAESEVASPRERAILYEFIWFGGMPVAQVDGTTTHWTFTDHLGTPLIQTDSAGAVYWRAEHEPYGRVFALRTADQHQPLRLPGQEAEQFNLGSNGATERSYNIFRWYRSNWGRYTQTDPLGLEDGGTNLYSYATDRPLNLIDPFGLRACTKCDECPSGQWSFQGLGVSAAIPFLWGRSRTWGTFTCEKDLLLKKVPVTVDCRIKGPILNLGGGLAFSTPFVPAACGCNSKDLLTEYEAFAVSISYYSAEVGDCDTGPAKTLVLGLGKSYGAGDAVVTWRVIPRQ